MAIFTVRVEMHGATGADYERLHAAMGARGFRRQITSDQRVAYDLPTAEYDQTNRPTGSAAVRDEVVAIAKTVHPDPSVLVTEAVGRAWLLFPA